MRISRQHDNGADLLVVHDRAEPVRSGLLGPENPLGPVHGAWRVEIVAVDAAVGCPGGADAGGQKDDLLFVKALR